MEEAFLGTRGRKCGKDGLQAACKTRGCRLPGGTTALRGVLGLSPFDG